MMRQSGREVTVIEMAAPSGYRLMPPQVTDLKRALLDESLVRQYYTDLNELGDDDL
jgi:hypothetical protein